MGVDYTPVAGYGIEVNNKLMKQIEKITGEEDYDAMDALGFEFAEAGAGNYTGEPNTYYLMVPDTDLQSVLESAREFVTEVNEKLGTSFTINDVKHICELHIW